MRKKNKNKLPGPGPARTDPNWPQPNVSETKTFQFCKKSRPETMSKNRTLGV